MPYEISYVIQYDGLHLFRFMHFLWLFPRDVLRDATRDSPRDCVHDPVRDFAHDPARIYTRDYLRECTRNSTRGNSSF
jgi:hypothetical protein